MRTAPAFDLHVAPGFGERALVALVCGASAAVMAVWLWSHVDAAAGPAGRGVAGWLVVGVGAALLGAGVGWRLGPCAPVTLHWGRGQWLLSRTGGEPEAGSLQAKLDLGNWMLLRFRTAGDGRATWLGVGAVQAGAAWHALRASLFATADRRGQRDEGASA